jgi:hypothetical protein
MGQKDQNQPEQSKDSTWIFKPSTSIHAEIIHLGDGVWRATKRTGRSAKDGYVVVESDGIFLCECKTTEWGFVCKHIVAVWLLNHPDDNGTAMSVAYQSRLWRGKVPFHVDGVWADAAYTDSFVPTERDENAGQGGAE